MNNEVAEHMLKDHDKRINNHDERLDRLEQNDVKRDIQIDNLCKSIEGLISTLKWGFGFICSGVIGFFFYAIQNHLFK
ncbi:hemolysin XhlA family protein [Paraclostridium sordellii]|uniref:hemolysin XhlA family protein n=1 Tax=Paraclostridium sordellii TaxID=1505 RepID=UPI0005DBDF30|nr:hemolysin XhlA family protein [Paeniclostridium sordellii]CEP50485.1 Haemolysin XhlA [[Clostridium] sordellii] [Paeniclostridium sordellii]CEQ27004.1 Haemolysin XhlA [[Clostridium] sordellii] [Paeniclostridium sordellii]